MADYVHWMRDQCSCPMGHDHTVEELEEKWPGLYKRMMNPDAE